MSTARRAFPAPLSTLTGRIQRLGMAIVAAFALTALLAPWLTAYAPDALVCTPFAPPSAAHWLGCNDVGHDLFSRLIHGARVSLTVGLAVATLATSVAVLVALTAGYRGGLVDQVLMRLVDVVMSLPFLPLVIVLGVYLGASITTQVLVIALVMWAQPVRELRAQVLALRSAEYVEAAVSMGAGPWTVYRRHLLPELAPLIVPQFVLVAHAAILIESSLSFLGLGDPVQTSWGSMLFYANARTAFLTGTWMNWVLPPGLCIALVVTAFALIGFGVGPDEIRRRVAPIGRARRPEPRPTAAALSIQSLTVEHLGAEHPRTVDRADLDLAAGEILALVGESGSGKTTAALASLRLHRPPAQITEGAVLVDGTDLLDLSEAALQGLRGKRLALVPQSAMNALNPVMTIEAQVREAITLHGRDRGASERARALLDAVGLDRSRHHAFPHELSGGMRQRAVIAAAIANEPDVVIADEPTTGLDVLTQAEIVRLLLELQMRRRMAVLFVTHNLPLVTGFADRVAVMHEGRIVDQGPVRALARNARHPHTRRLFASVLPLAGTKRWRRARPAGGPLLEVRGVTKRFRPRGFEALVAGGGVLAVDGVSFTIDEGEVVGLVGGSGSGKSTTARLVVGRYRPDRGSVHVAGAESVRDAAQMVFQDPYQSIRPSMAVADVVAEPLRTGRRDRRGGGEAARVRDALEAVMLPSGADFLRRRAQSLSGGQRQRLALARAIVTEPRLIVADEPTSMLDQSLRLDILALMERLRAERGTSFLFITHDIALARHFCDRLLVMDRGRIVEAGDADQVALSPRHAYTRALIEAVEGDPLARDDEARLPHDVEMERP